MIAFLDSALSRHSRTSLHLLACSLVSCTAKIQNSGPGLSACRRIHKCPGLHVGVCGVDQARGLSHGPSFPTTIYKNINESMFNIGKIKVGIERMEKYWTSSMYT